MKKSAVVISALLPLVALGSCHLQRGDASYEPRQAEAEIRQIERDWAHVAVTGDPSVIERIFADDFLGVTPEGAQYTKQGFIDDTKKNPLRFTSNEVNDIKIRLFGNVALAQGDETFRTGTGEQGRFVWTDVLARRDGRWQIVAGQDAVAPATRESRDAALFTAADPSATARKEIAKTRSAYASAWQRASASEIAQLYTEDALVLYPSQPPVSGRSAILDYFQDFFHEFPANEFELVSAEVMVTGPWAVDRGSYQWKGTPRAGGKPEADNGKYLVVLQRQSDGAWRVARDMDNSNRPLTQATRGAR